MKYLIYGSTHPQAMERPEPEAVLWSFQAQARSLAKGRALARWYGRKRQFLAVRIFLEGKGVGRLVEEFEINAGIGEEVRP